MGTKMTRWCKCGGYILTNDQERLGEICDKCRKEQIDSMQVKKEEENGGMDNSKLESGV